MKRLRRWLFNFAAVVSAMLCVATGIFWIRSYFVHDWCSVSRVWQDARWMYWSQHNLQSGSGGIGYNLIVQAAPPDVGWKAFFQREGVRPLRHGTSAAAYPDFKFRAGDAPKWGFNFGYFKIPERQWSTLVRGMTGTKPGSQSYQAIIPYWALASALVLVPALWFWRWRVRRLNGLAGHCPICGYDLRATPDRCPECGSVRATAKMTGT